MFKPKAISGNNLKFKVKPIGRGKLTYFIGKELDMVSLFIDDANLYGIAASSMDVKCMDGGEPLLLRNPSQSIGDGLPRDQLYTYCPSYYQSGIHNPPVDWQGVS